MLRILRLFKIQNKIYIIVDSYFLTSLEEYSKKK